MTPAATHPIATPEPQEARTQRHLAVLDGLIEVGARMVQRHEAQNVARAEAAIAAGQPVPAIELEHEATAYDRTTRSIRRSIMLCEQLSQPKAAPPPPELQRADSRRVVLRRVEDRIHQTTHGEPADQLRAELHERLDSPEFEDDITRRPVEDIINEIARDLGLEFPGKRLFVRRSPKDVAALHARAVAPASGTGPAPAVAGLADPAQEVAFLLDYAARSRGGG